MFWTRGSCSLGDAFMRSHGSICMTGLTLALQSRSDHLVECIFPLQYAFGSRSRRNKNADSRSEVDAGRPGSGCRTGGLVFVTQDKSRGVHLLDGRVVCASAESSGHDVTACT